MIDWELHRDAVEEMWLTCRSLLVGLARILLSAVAAITIGVLLATYPVFGVMAIVLLVLGAWYLVQYGEAKRRRDLRQRTGGTCG